MGDTGSEPSMEDILSSIKRIIAEEGDSAGAKTRRQDSKPEANHALPREERPKAGEDPAVLELKQAVEPSGAAPDEADAARERERERARAILSERTTEATRGKLAALSRMVVKPETPGSDTLEGLVREMLRPMLSEWLDANLPAIVEAMVAREIARISSLED